MAKMRQNRLNYVLDLHFTSSHRQGHEEGNVTGKDWRSWLLLSDNGGNSKLWADFPSIKPNIGMPTRQKRS